MSFFAWAEIAVSINKSDVMFGSLIYDNGYTVMQMKKALHQTKPLSSRFNLRKDFDWKKTSLDVTFSYQRRANISDNRSLRNTILVETALRARSA